MQVVESNETALSSISQASRFLAQAKNLEQTIEVRDRAGAIAAYARSRGAKESYGLAMELMLRAERKAGEFLKERVVHEGARGKGVGNIVLPTGKNKLSELGISKTESSRWQKLASIPESKFEVLVQDAAFKTEKALVQVGKEIEAEIERQNPTPIEQPKEITVELIHGDFQLSDQAESSVDLILTDPPYGKDWLNIWEPLSKFGAKVLKPGGWLVAYTGHAWFDEKLAALSKHLKYDWIIALLGDQTGSLQKGDYESHWKPVVVYSKPPRGDKRVYSDRISADPDYKKDKRNHDWGQDFSPFCSFLDVFSKPGDLVFEPFAGGGTTVEACIETKRNCIAYEIDNQTYKNLKKRFPDST